MSRGVLLQVRLHSTRLPRKALLPLRGGNVLEHVLRALAGIEADVHAVLTDARSSASFTPFAQEAGFTVFIGSEEDVLDRYAQAVRHFSLTTVIRATGDNPLVSASAAAVLLEEHERGGFDLSHFPELPLGTGVEALKAEALLDAADKAKDPFEREHITTYMYRHKNAYRVGEPACPPQWAMPGARVTLDTREDYESICRIFDELYRGSPVEIEELVAWLGRARAGHEEGA
jgi:spore coat polysaccharide biosynthesis protein SpsF